MNNVGKQNVSLFLGAMLSVGTFWFLLLGFMETSPLKLVGGMLCLVGAVFSFRYYRDQLRLDRDG